MSYGLLIHVKDKVAYVSISLEPATARVTIGGNKTSKNDKSVSLAKILDLHTMNSNPVAFGGR